MMMMHPKTSLAAYILGCLCCQCEGFQLLASHSNAAGTQMHTHTATHGKGPPHIQSLLQSDISISPHNVIVANVAVVVFTVVALTATWLVQRCRQLCSASKKDNAPPKATHAPNAGPLDGLSEAALLDRQVQIRGVRIDLGEMEALVGECWTAICKNKLEIQGKTSLKPEAARVACVASNDEVPQLIVFVAPVATDSELARLQAHVDEFRPMWKRCCVSHYLTVDKLPTLSNGKTDAKALQSKAASQLSDCVWADPVEDSLGVMKTVLREDANDLNIIYHCYTFGIFAVIFGHLYSISAITVFQRHFHVEFLLFREAPWLLQRMVFYATGPAVFGSFITSFMFIKAYQDSAPTPPSKEPNYKLTFGAGDVVLVWAFVLDGLIASANNLLCSEGPWAGGILVSARWFIGSILWGRLFVACCQRVRVVHIPPAAQILMIVAFSLSFRLTFDLCAMQWPPDWLRIVVGIFVAPFSGTRTSCPLFLKGNNSYEWFAAFYVIGFYHSSTAVRFARDRLPKLGESPYGSVAAFGLFLLVAVNYWNVAPDGIQQTLFTPPSIGGALGNLLCIVIDTTTQVLICGLFGLAASSFPWSAKKPGQAMLGSYIGHFGMFPFNAYSDFIYNQQVSFSGNLAIILTITLVWVVALGPAVHFLMMLPLRALRITGD